MTGFPKRVRALVEARANGFCERCGQPALVFQHHHRRPRGMGGSKADDTNSSANGLCVCVPCHREIEANRVEALAHGWLVRQGDDPAAAPVFRRGEWVLLDNDGQIKPATWNSIMAAVWAGDA